MTHPDIIKAEIFGYPHGNKICKTGVCLNCEADLYDDNGEAVVSTDGMFCSMECCCEYYEISPIEH